ncbi:MAG: hypothetical protein HYY40_08770 [Bacteroidetes bacterium]|nr:hypothetical protein [Bacteroidota bacterium]
MRNKWDNIWFGLVLGLIIPPLVILLYYLYFFGYMTIHQFINFTIQGNVYTHIISLCVIPDAGLFFLFVWKDFVYAGRGVLIATFIYAFLVYGLKFLM